MIACVVFLTLLLTLAACSPQTPQKAAIPTPSPELLEGLQEPTLFAGNAACKACHEAEFTQHAHSRHMQTLREATVADLGTLAPAPGPVPGGGVFTIEQGRLVTDSPNALTKSERMPLQVALGSGKTGMTFMALFEKSGAEIRQSYFPQEKTWHMTPGRKNEDEVRNGRIYKEAELRACLECHAVTLPLSRLMPERRFMGVGCESCHGAGKEHIEAMTSGEKPAGLGLTRLQAATGTELNELCGKCHRTADDVQAIGEAAQKMTQRFQPYGLSLSKCFKQSNNKLTCVTCHNPHTDASLDHKAYDNTCLSCHSAPKSVCPVNPKEKCVSCHMPQKRLFNPAKSTIPISMADHFIRIYKDSRPAR